MIVNTVGPPTAKMFLVGEAPGKDEDFIGQPFVGYAGRTLNLMLTQANISRPECLVGNVARERPPGNKIAIYFEDKDCRVPTEKMRHWINQLKTEIEIFKPNIVVALGATALWALTGEKTISKYRGYVMESTLVPGQKVLATYHPQNVNYEWKNFFPTVLDLRKAKYHSDFPDIPKDKRTLVPNASKDDFIQYCREIMSHDDWPDIVLDVETVQPGSHISILGLSHSKNFAMNIVFIKGRMACFNERDEIELWKWIDTVLTNKNIIIHNAQYDVLVLYINHGILPNTKMCTLIAAHALWPELPRDLGFLASLCLDVPAWKMTSREHPYLYNAGDCAATFGIAEFFRKEMIRQEVNHTFNFEMSQLPVAEMLQVQGIAVDKNVQAELIKECDGIIEETGNTLERILGRKINYGSHTQLKQLLYMDLGLPVQYKRRKRATDPRKVTADAEALRKLARLVPDNPIFKLILEHKKYLKLKSSFVDIELSPAGKVHTSYNITGKKDNKDDNKVDEEGRKSFGRWSSSQSIILPYGSGNLQNIPPLARKMYRAPNGFSIIQGDLVQAEAVEVAYQIDDQMLKLLFKKRLNAPKEEKKKYDVHKYTASQMFGIAEDKVTPEQRRIGKTLRHATNYDAGPGVLASRLGCSQADAKKLKELYHQSCPRLRLWYQQIQQKLGHDRTLVTPMGRKHRFLDRYGDDLFRSAYSFIPQSTVGDILNKSLVMLYEKYGEELTILLQLHDAIYVMVENERVNWAIQVMTECMTHTIEVNNDQMTIEVDFKVGPSWGEMEEVA